MVRLLTTSVQPARPCPSSPPPALSLDALASRGEASLEVAAAAVDAFLSHNEPDLRQLEHALAAGDVARIASVCYRIENQARHIGAEQTAEVASDISHCCRRGQCESLPLQIWKLEQVLRQLQDAVDELL